MLLLELIKWLQFIIIIIVKAIVNWYLCSISALSSQVVKLLSSTI